MLILVGRVGGFSDLVVSFSFLDVDRRKKLPKVAAGFLAFSSPSSSFSSSAAPSSNAFLAISAASSSLSSSTFSAAEAPAP